MGLKDRLRGKRTPEDAFADEVSRLVTQLLPVQKVERGDDFSLKLTIRGKTEPTHMFLQNIFVEASRLEGAARDERLRIAVLAMTPSDRPKTWAEAQPRLMPSLRAASWAAATTIMGKSPFRREFAPFVELMVAVDDEHSMSFVTDDDIREWGVDEEAVLATAIANLAKTPAPVGGPEGAPWLEVHGPDGYVSSWLVVPDALMQFGASLGDELVAVTKSRDSLRLISTRDAGALEQELNRVEAEYLAEPRQLSPVPYQLQSDRLVAWDPPADHPCRRVVDRLHRILAMREYDLQLNVLTDLFAKSGVDVYVAKYTLMERENRTVWSWCTWVRQVTDGLLPETDYVCLGDNNDSKASVWVRWDDAVRLAGVALRDEPDYSPGRWRVHGWPDDAVMATLRNAAVDPPNDGP
ncbi:MAG: hypothetical protein QOD92_2436 [Acidimicrobiaceae bacterium]|jgi:hypothetical protein